MKKILFTEKGIVQRGKGWGHKMGYPTANILCANMDLSGTYAGHVMIADDTMKHVAAIYVDKGRKLLEAHLLDFEGDLYGKKIQITLYERIAQSEKFKDPTLLQQHIAESVQRVRNFFLELDKKEE